MEKILVNNLKIHQNKIAKMLFKKKQMSACLSLQNDIRNLMNLFYY